jgi:hypothetical protein
MNNYRRTKKIKYSCIRCAHFILYREEYGDIKASDIHGFCTNPENTGSKGEVFSTDCTYTCCLFDEIFVNKLKED